MRPCAFSLIELLVVISIVAVLIALLLPAIKKAKENAWVVSCGSQLHQVHVGSVGFASDHDGMLIRHEQLRAHNGGPANMHFDSNTVHVIYASGVGATAYDVYFLPYFNYSREVFFCPAHPVRADFAKSSPEGKRLGWGWPSPLVDNRMILMTLANIANLPVNGFGMNMPVLRPDDWPIARTIDDDPKLGLWTDFTSWNIRGGGNDPGNFDPPVWQATNHPASYYHESAGFNLIVDGTRVGRNLATISGDVSYATFDEIEATKFRIRTQSRGDGYYISF